MSESTKVTKNESEKARSFMGVRRNFSRGGNVDILFVIFKMLTISVPFKIILQKQICFSEHDYFGAEYVEFTINYKLCELYNKYIILSKYFILIASCLRAVPLLWNVASAWKWDFTARQFWWSWVFAPLRENIADNAAQMDVHKTPYPTLRRKCPMLG